MELICGIDEAGRGPLAGPVVAAAVILPRDFPFGILNDSKKLSPKKREVAEKDIKKLACWGVGIVDHKKIEEINILQASLLAMKAAFEDMKGRLSSWAEENGDAGYRILAIVDGRHAPKIDCEGISCEIKADSKIHPVMAASIIAKTTRDRIMLEMDALYPQYGYARHKGYPTAAHKAACKKFGPSPIQRLTFKC